MAQHDRAVEASNNQERSLVLYKDVQPVVPDVDKDDEAKRIGLRFRLRNELIYYINFDDGRERLCVPESLESEVFKLAHDEQHHGGFHRTYERITKSMYLRHLSKRLRKYIEHCPRCQLNQTKRHRPYGNMVPIDRPGIPFHTVTMDFIMALPVTDGGFDCLLTITCKFSKRVLLVPGQSNWGAEKWAEVTLAALIGHDWGIPYATISDRDTKFVSVFWKSLFKALGCELLTSTAYHAQTDGQSERTNQTVEIAVRFYLATYITAEWTSVIPYLQGYLNNASNRATGLAPNEITYGFKARDTIDALSIPEPAQDFGNARQRNRQAAQDSIAFANIFAKARYDSQHKPIEVSKGNKVYLKLGHGYDIPGVNPKLHQQRVGPFKVIDKVGRLAYRLELPPLMKIHPVVSIAQLEPLPLGPDPYHRPQNDDLPQVIEREGLAEDEFRVEAIIGKRKGNKYLVKWKDYGHQHNWWYHIRDLQDSLDLVEDYERRTHDKLTSRRSGRVRKPTSRADNQGP